MDDPDFSSWEISPLENPAQRAPALTAVENKQETFRPSRIILEVAEKPSLALIRHIEKNGYEMNREFPEHDMIKQVMGALLLGMAGIGAMLSLLSIATFATSFRLVIAQMSEHVRNLLLIGFSHHEISRIFFVRFVKLFVIILFASVGLGYLVKQLFVSQASDMNFIVEDGFSLMSMLALSLLFVSQCS